MPFHPQDQGSNDSGHNYLVIIKKWVNRHRPLAVGTAPGGRPPAAPLDSNLSSGPR